MKKNKKIKPPPTGRGAGGGNPTANITQSQKKTKMIPFYNHDSVPVLQLGSRPSIPSQREGKLI